MNTTKSGFQWRALTSVLISACFLLLMLSGAMLFVSPPGRIANWTDWTILGLTKGQWSGVHIWFAAIFVIAGVVHLVLNWRPFLNYFKNKLTRHLGFRREWLAALGITAAIFAGTLAGITPFSSLMALNERVKNSWDKPADRAPIPHAERLTLAELAGAMQMDLAAAEARLHAAGWSNFASGTVIADIAQANRASAKQLYEVMGHSAGSNPGPGRRGGGSGGSGGGGGMGRKTLAEYCDEQGIPVADALAHLQAHGIKARGHNTIRELSNTHGYDRPRELLDIVEGPTR